MIKKILPKGEFGRNVLTLMTGTSVAQAIPVAIAPLLTRIYTPADFGLLALFISVTAIFGSVANGRYELAIMLPEGDEEALNIAALGLAIALGISLLLLAAVIVFNSTICRLLRNDSIGHWLYFVPLTVFFTGLHNVLNYFNNRIKNYKDIAKASVYKSLVLATVQVILGLFKHGATGLLAGQILSVISSNLKLLKNTLATADVRATVGWGRMKTAAWRYRDFPKYSMGAILANTLATHLNHLLISAYYSIATLGFYSLVHRVLGIPTTLVGSAMGQVFFQQATNEKLQTGVAAKSFDHAVKRLVLIAAPAFGVMFFVIEDVFAAAFGENWRVAGQQAKILVPFFAVRFVVAAVSNINNVFEKQKIALAWQVLLLAISVGSLFAAQVFGYEFRTFLLLYSALAGSHYIALYFILRRVARGLL